MFLILFWVFVFFQGIYSQLPNLNANNVNCDMTSPPPSIDINQITFYAWTRGEEGIRYYQLNPDNATLLREIFSSPRTTWVLFFFHDSGNHGQEQWILSSSSDILNAVEGYFNQFAAVAISVDYKVLATSKSQAISYVEQIANRSAELIIRIKSVISNIETHPCYTGHGIGANIAARTSELLTQYNPDWASIILIALDPELPACADAEIPQINEFLAQQVFVMHTTTCSHTPIIPACDNSSKSTMGDVDYFPNGGHDQPGCLQADLMCGRKRAAELFVEAASPLIPGERMEFRCWLCDNYEQFLQNQCPAEVQGVVHTMDFYFHEGPSGRMYLNTNPSSPFSIE